MIIRIFKPHYIFIPDPVYKKLKKIADKEGIPFREVAIKILEKYLKESELEPSREV